MNIFLTSAGFDNKNILKRFLQLINVENNAKKIIFIPTAAINDGGKAMLPFCKQEIIEAGFLKDNIKDIEISEMKTIKNINEYCAIYVAGGDTKYLVKEMRNYDFKNILDKYLENGGVYFGVSAGSIALTNSFNGCLKYINCKLNVHQDKGTNSGKLKKNEYSEINLTDNQAIIIQNECIEIFE